MPIVSVKYAQTHLSELIKQANNGEIVTVTNHGEPVATIGPPKRKGERSKVLYGCLEHLKGLGDKWDTSEENDRIAGLFYK